MPSNDDLLDAAAAAFADKGYDGARMDEIAKAAGVNKATLYYRIGDKDAIYTAVLKRLFSAKTARLEAMLDTVSDPHERIRAFAQILVDSDHPQRFPAIMLREIADGGRNLPDEVLPLMGRVVGALEQTLADGAEDGHFKPVNPFLTHMMLVGACALYATNAPIRRRVAALRPDSETLNADLALPEAAGIVADMLLDAIRKT